MDDAPLDLASLRVTYETAGLDRADMEATPFAQFRRWFDEVAESAIVEPNAAVLATVGAEGAPHARHVLAKGASDLGFVFFTNYASGKGRQLAANPVASLVFAWSALARQVIVEGPVERLAPEESDVYFASRPRGSQLGAWASPQSSVIDGRSVLDDAYAAAEDRYRGTTVPRPEHWGGFRLDPIRVEFWQGRPSRLHDRLRYERCGDRWTLVRLAP